MSRILIAIALLVSAVASARAQTEPKEATEATKAANAAVANELPFDDRQAFEDAHRGFLAPLPDQGVIRDETRQVIWDLTPFKFLEDGDAPATVNPSLWRQGQLLVQAGLYKVTDDIHQVRSADLSNMTIIRGKRGLIIIDPLLSKGTAKAALQLYFQHFPPRPVRAVIYTHSHVDHYGGVKGVVSEDDVKSGRVRIYAPEGFVEAALAENVMAGANMSRRALYSYGAMLPQSPKGNVGTGLGMTVSTGEVTFINPTHVIDQPVKHVEIDGIRVVFMLAPGTEAPSEMLIHFPKFKALCSAEDAVHTLHNLYTLRGAKVRDAKAWSHYLNEAIDQFGKSSNVVFAQHHWPTWGQANVVDFLEKQRDMYKYLHDQTLRLANHGYNMTEAAEMMTIPDSIGHAWYNRGYYGSVNHNTKAVWNFYLGWFNSNPANLHPLPPVEAGRRYVDFMGGAARVLERARASYNDGDYRWVAEVVNHVVQAYPDNAPARELLADAYEQMGYQSENGTWRNHYLMGAQELRHGVKKGPATNTVSGDTLAAMPVDMVLDYLAIRLNGPKAAGREITLNLNVTDTGSRYMIVVKNGVLNYFPDRQAKKPDAGLSMKRATLNKVLAGESTVKDETSAGHIIVKGDAGKLDEVLGLLDTFDMWWNVVTPRDS